jgi:hypothetical protein
MLFHYGIPNLRCPSPYPFPNLKYVLITHPQDAVSLLNSLQTPYEVLKKRWDAGIRIDSIVNQEMRKCLERIGYTVPLSSQPKQEPQLTALTI